MIMIEFYLSTMIDKWNFISVYLFIYFKNKNLLAELTFLIYLHYKWQN